MNSMLNRRISNDPLYFFKLLGTDGAVQRRGLNCRLVIQSHHYKVTN
jgi:hypothetical protein